MSIFAAVGWTFGAMFVAIVFLSVATAIREGARFDLVTLVFAQMIANGLALFGILRLYAPDASVRELLGFRGTQPLIYPLALTLGVAISPATSKLLELIFARWPRAEASHIDELLLASSPVRQVVIGVLIGGLVPVVEEAFFRGALFAPLRRFMLGDGGSRPLPPERAAWLAVFATSFLFVTSHVEWQTFAPLAAVAAMMGVLRYRSGSLLPSILVHVGLNTTSVVMTVFPPPTELVPWSWAIGSAVVSGALFAGMLWLSRGARAVEARAAEL
ncbi:MAG: CPBP family intramembrane metalloprotease [Polyangiaceae bacterium]|jgi:membrane protease YdiL (CAAX protease family)|nr:CPBP family intramembrane metalloprotease [Polyangiaceae bacterium]MBK8942288.1 CPBP family intramembrane metalloprotease [Polyangiaceae bacterium]